jgi:tRNA G18 (ribose-2'-O)-methylase SpoU
MPDIQIHDVTDPRIGAYVDLPQGQRREREGRFIVEGDFLVQRLLSSDCRVDSLLVSADQRDRLHVAEDMTVYVAARSLLPQITGFKFHRAMLGCGIRPPQTSLTEALANTALPSMAVICVAIHDQQNLGGILRNCAAFGVDLVMLADHCADPWARRTLRVSMGATFQLNLCWSADLARDLSRFREEFSFDLIAAVLDASAEDLAAAQGGHRLALLFGNEGYGLQPDRLKLCDRRVTIPMRLQTDSLNVAVATGIFLYHFNKGQPS